MNEAENGAFTELLNTLNQHPAKETVVVELIRQLTGHMTTLQNDCGTDGKNDISENVYMDETLPSALADCLGELRASVHTHRCLRQHLKQAGQQFMEHARVGGSSRQVMADGVARCNASEVQCQTLGRVSSYPSEMDKLAVLSLATAESSDSALEDGPLQQQLPQQQLPQLPQQQLPQLPQQQLAQLPQQQLPQLPQQLPLQQLPQLPQQQQQPPQLPQQQQLQLQQAPLNTGAEDTTTQHQESIETHSCIETDEDDEALVLLISHTSPPLPFGTAHPNVIYEDRDVGSQDEAKIQKDKLEKSSSKHHTLLTTPTTASTLTPSQPPPPSQPTPPPSPPLLITSYTRELQSEQPELADLIRSTRPQTTPSLLRHLNLLGRHVCLCEEVLKCKMAASK